MIRVECASAAQQSEKVHNARSFIKQILQNRSIIAVIERV
jgi:hypothetical protein